MDLFIYSSKSLIQKLHYHFILQMLTLFRGIFVTLSQESNTVNVFLFYFKINVLVYYLAKGSAFFMLTCKLNKFTQHIILELSCFFLSLVYPFTHCLSHTLLTLSLSFHLSTKIPVCGAFKNSSCLYGRSDEGGDAVRKTIQTGTQTHTCTHF